MMLKEIYRLLDQVCSDDYVVNLAKKVTLDAGNGYSVEVELEDGSVVYVEQDDVFTVITKACFKERFDIEFGAIKALVAIGECREAGGIVTASKCFSTLYFDEKVKLISIDYHKNFR